MKFQDACIPVNALWSSPFVRWQGALAEVSSLDVAVSTASAGLARAQVDPASLDALVLGWSVPQQGIFYGGPWVAARLGAPGITGPMVSQACATSVAALQAAAVAAQADPRASVLALVTDRTSNGPSLLFPAPSAPAGAPHIEHWVLDSFRRDPWAGESMVATAEHVAREAGFTREAIDDVTLLRYEQYAAALADDRAFQREYMVPVTIPAKRRAPLVVDADAGVHASTRDGLAALATVQPEGLVTYGSQTHPADGAAGAVLMSRERALALAGDAGVVEILATGFGRAEKARMPKAPVLAAQAALADAGVSLDDVHLVCTHNPFAVNDLWFHRQTGFALERMNPYGCSLVYGHPQAPTGMRAIAELVHALRRRGGGVGLFTGCAAGDTGAAVVLRVAG